MSFQSVNILSSALKNNQNLLRSLSSLFMHMYAHNILYIISLNEKGIFFI